MQLHAKQGRLLGMLCCLMTLFIISQVVFLTIHYHVADIFQSIAGTSLSHNLLHPAILLPIFANILIQITCYALILLFVWLVAIGVSEKFHLSPTFSYWLGIFCLLLAMTDLLTLNSYYFPTSFFAIPEISGYFLFFSALAWLAGATIAFRKVGWLLVGFITLNGLVLLPPLNKPSPHTVPETNIILIGLDSLRPDFTGFDGKRNIKTPTIDNFLHESSVFDQSYTPLARTFPAWVSILTARHPKHHGARNNLADASQRVTNNTLAKTLQKAGYYTIYASDEKRFSNITTAFGFDHLAGPSMGINDFLLGSLLDFPVTNLLTTLPIAKFILPYNYANRAAIVTYQPDQLLTLVDDAIANRPEKKPLLLAVHLCLTHWPYTWASTLGKDEILPLQYQHSVEAIDQQLNNLLTMLKQRGVLNNSIVVLLSDHGTALGLPHDTLLDKKNYFGDPIALKNIPIIKLSNSSHYSLDFKHDYVSHTTYGQGTNVASIKQYHTLLAFRRYGKEPFMPQRISTPVSLTDIAPTLLALLRLPPLKNSDGISLAANLENSHQKNQASSRAFFIETGDSLSEIETNHIFLEKVLAKKAGLYRVDPQSALLTIDPLAEKAIIKSKQRAIIWNDWMLARYPVSTREKLVPVSKNASQMKLKSFTIPAYYVLINLKTGQWTIGLDTPFAKSAPIAALSKQFHEFYGNEINDNIY